MRSIKLLSLLFLGLVFFNGFNCDVYAKNMEDRISDNFIFDYSDILTEDEELLIDYDSIEEDERDNANVNVNVDNETIIESDEQTYSNVSTENNGIDISPFVLEFIETV